MHVAEAHVVHRMRSAVDLHDERISPGRIEARRFHDPTVHRRAARGYEAESFHLAELEVREQLLVHSRELGDLAGVGCRAEANDVGGRLVARAHGSRASALRDGQSVEHVLAVGDGSHATVHRREVRVGCAVIREREIDAAAVSGPLHVFGIAIVVAGEPARTRTIHVHHVQLRAVIAGRELGVPTVGDAPAVR